MRKFKSYTARKIIDNLVEKGPKFFLDQLKWHKQAYKSDQTYQVWQEGYHPQMIADEIMLNQKIEYIHNNPVKRGYVDRPEHWRYSSSRNYLGRSGLLEIERVG